MRFRFYILQLVLALLPAIIFVHCDHVGFDVLTVERDGGSGADSDGDASPGKTCGDGGAASIWYPDCDGDGEKAYKQWIEACDETEADALFDCQDGDPPDGRWSKTEGTDCNDEDNTVVAASYWYHDCDGDGAHDKKPERACGISGANTSFSCLDGEIPDGGWTETPSTDDCNDEDHRAQKFSSWYPDCDGDGLFSPSPRTACGKKGADEAYPCVDGEAPDGSWSSTPGTDCDDDTGQSC